jgi:hypothetical protein
MYRAVTPTPCGSSRYLTHPDCAAGARSSARAPFGVALYALIREEMASHPDTRSSPLNAILCRPSPFSFAHRCALGRQTSSPCPSEGSPAACGSPDPESKARLCSQATGEPKYQEESPNILLVTTLQRPAVPALTIATLVAAVIVAPKLICTSRSGSYTGTGLSDAADRPLQAPRKRFCSTADNHNHYTITITTHKHKHKHTRKA